jgi:hypothetical protein
MKSKMKSKDLDTKTRRANLMSNRSGLKFHVTSVLVCPDCNETVRVGFRGKKNLAIHHTSKACQIVLKSPVRSGLLSILGKTETETGLQI